MSNKDEPKHSFDAVRKEIVPDRGIALHEFGLDITQSVINDAYKNGAIQEPIYGVNEIIASESLARPKDKINGSYSIGLLSEEFYKRGLAEKFDALTCSVGIDHARHFPATLNIAVESVLSVSFWEKIDDHVKGVDPKNFIFEILEHDVDPNADISHLHELKDMGYRFALDDYYGNKIDSRRLAVFGELVDYIKIDGPLVRAGLGDEVKGHSAEKFREVFDDIKARFPDVMLIAERVRSAEEAQKLFDMGFDGVQGRDLKPEFFHYTTEAMALANQVAACDNNEHNLTL